MIETPEIVTTEPQPYAYIHRTIPVAEVSKVIGASMAEIHAALAAQGASPSGPWFTHHLRRPSMTFDFEICVPVGTPVHEAGDVKCGLWLATSVVRTIFSGNYSGLPAAWGELERWMRDGGHPQGTEFWERYVIDPGTSSDPNAWRTELNWPLAG